MENEYFTIIVGGGPAGLQCAYYLQKNKRKYIILEAEDCAGATFKMFPRHKKLISINKVYTGETDYEKNLRWDWNGLLHDEADLAKLPMFKEYTGEYFPHPDFLVKYLQDFADNFDINIAYNTKVTDVSKKNGKFTVSTSTGKNYVAQTVVVCTGFKETNTPPVPGIEMSEPYTTMNVDPQDYCNQEVLIIGKGNSGFETADNITGTAALIHLVSPDPVKFAWKTHYVGDLRAVNNNFLDTYQLKSQNAVLDALVVGMTKNADGKRIDVELEYAHAHGEKETLTYDRVLNCTGFVFDNSIFDESATPITSYGGKFPKQSVNWESENVEGLYFGGVLMHERDYKKHTSGFIHGWRYNCRILIKQLEKTYFLNAFPSYQVPATPKGLVDAVIARVNRCSCMWQQFGYIGDFITVDKDTGVAKYYEEFTMEQVLESKEIMQNNQYYTVTLEFNKVCGDPFAINRNPNPDAAQESIFLHPVVRHYNNGRLLNEIHILEDLYTNWTHPTQHILPLTEFFKATFMGKKGFVFMKPKM